MNNYSYKAKSKEGKIIKGTVETKNKHEAVRVLEQMDLAVFQLDSSDSILTKEIQLGKPLKQKDFIVFLRQFATLMRAGILLVEALELLAEQTESQALKKALEDISEATQEGSALSTGMEQYPKLFPDLLVQMIKTGEVSGQLEDVLERMANYYEKQYELRQKISTALTYPLVVACFSIIITLFLMLFIVPIFGDLFASMGSDIPAITLAVLSTSQFIKRYWWIFIVGIGFIAVAFMRLKEKESIAIYLDTIILKLPIVGSFVQKTVLARMTQTLSSLINSSVPILQSVEVTSEVVGNRVVQKVLLEARDSLERGESLAEPMEAHWVFPPLITQMIHVGEQSGALDEMLSKVADIYNREVNEASDKLQALIEPVLIIFLAIIVGIIVLSIVIPMFSLFEAF